MKQNKIFKILVIIFPIICLFSVFMLREHLLSLAMQMPKCPTYTVFNFKCPACGNTRSVMALLNFDLLGSLKYNIVPVVLIICATLLYIELVAYLFGKRIKILTKSPVILYTIIFAMIFYFIIRNFF